MEDLHENKTDVLNDADYIFYFVDNLFMVDHKEQKTYFAANALVTGDFDEAYSECASKIQNYKNLVNEKYHPPKLNNLKKSRANFESDTAKDEFIGQVNRIKQHILAGDVYQCVISRTISADFHGNSFDIYRKLREVNPSPYMFFINSGDGVLLGASPEMNLRVESSKE